jgi:hypothetical protein
MPGERAATLVREPGKQPYYQPTYPTWSTNRDRSIHYMERDEIKNLWLGGAKYAATNWRQSVGYYGKLPYATVQMRFFVKNARAADPHNFCGTVLKAAVDGLVKANFWPNDTALWVGHRESLLTVEQVMPTIYIFFEGDRPWEQRPT